MGITLKYYHYFGDQASKLGEYLNTPQSWDLLRKEDNSLNNGAFFIPENRSDWVAYSQKQSDLNKHAQDIVDIIQNKYQSIHSLGVGAGHLEWLIKNKNPSLIMKCSDFTPVGIARLKKVFIEAKDVFLFDMLAGDWRALDKNDLFLFYRVDTVFDDTHWRKVFRSMAEAGINNVLFIPSYFLTGPMLLKQQFNYFICKIMNKKLTFSGFVRSRNKFISLLNEYYRIEKTVDIGNSAAFLISRKKVSE